MLYGKYKNTKQAALQVLADFHTTSFPVDISAILKTAGIKLLKNGKIKKLRDNELTVTFVHDNNWKIIYDDTASENRLRFDLAREFGHILLGHPLQPGMFARIFDLSNPICEKQADEFAVQLLCPACVLQKMQVRTAKQIQDICAVSPAAAEVCAEQMNETSGNQTDSISEKICRQFGQTENLKTTV